MNAALILLLASAFYFFETVVDTAPSVMIRPLMQHFHINAFHLGVLDVSYFALAALIQIPGAYALERWGERKVMPLAALCCGVGLVIVLKSDHFAWAVVGRMLSGMGSAFGILGGLFMISKRVSSRWQALALGAAMMIGLSGALVDGWMAKAVEHWGWQGLLWLLAAMAGGFAVLFRTLLDGRRLLPAQTVSAYGLRNSRSANPSRLKVLKCIFKDKTLLLIAFYGGLMYLPAGVLGALWGTHFIQQALPGISLPQAAFTNSLIFLGWMLGSPIAGLLSDLFHNRRLFLVLGSGSCLSLFLILFLKTHYSVSELSLIFLGIGLASSCSGLTFVMGVERHPEARAFSIAWINLWAILPMLIFNPLYGRFLDGLGFSSLHANQMALLPLLILLGLALILAL